MKPIYFIFISVMLLPVFGFSQTTVTLSVSKDAAIGFHDGANTANNNYGTATNNSAFWIPSALVPSPGVNANRALIDFNLNVIPANALVTSAYLNLYAYGPVSVYPGHFGSNACYLERINQPWQEMTVTWNNQPGTTSQNNVTLPQSLSPTQDYTNINVLPLVLDMIGNPATSFGFKLKLISEVVSNGVFFCSNDHGTVSKRPTLVITYVECTGPVQPSATNTSICTGNVVSLTASVAAPATVNWFNSPASGQSIGSGTLFVSPALTANITPSVYTFYAGNSTCGTDQRSPISVTVNPAPQLNIQSTRSVICAGQTTTLTAGGAITYSWSKNSTQFSNSQTVAVSPTTTSVYALSGTNSYSCTSSSLFTVSVSKCVGMAEEVAVVNDLSIFPNPSNGRFTISINLDKVISYTVVIEDLQGKLIRTFKVIDAVTQLTDLQVSPGVYLCKLISKDQIIQTKKLIFN